ncbi:MAG: acetoin utilization protein AcuC [Gammaproteobacteria bacterium]
MVSITADHVCTATSDLATTESQQKAGVGKCRAIYIDNEVFRRPAYGNNHPLAIPRTETVFDLCRALGWLPDVAVVSSDIAPEEILARFHTTEYLYALQQADRKGVISRQARERYGLGTMENPIFSGVYERAATAVGGSIKAAELALEGHLAFHPAGGTHHGKRDRASGFCYLNDPVFAILTLLEAGLERVLYVDLDAHHGDGVEAAFDDDLRVYLLSMHEADRWPNTGQSNSSERMCNLTLPARCSDENFVATINEFALPFSKAANPQAVVVTCGADSLAGDPLSTMAIKNGTLWWATEQFIALSNISIVLGGGGYNPWTLARCWSGLWGRLAGFDLPTTLPSAARQILCTLECDLIDEDEIPKKWFESLID